MNYEPGDKVKIISLEKVRSYPEKRDGHYKIGDQWLWTPEMDRFAGTTQIIEFEYDGFYDMEGIDYTFSPEMIEGPADPVEQEVRKNTKGTGGKPTSLNWVDPAKRAADQIQQQEGQEELWEAAIGGLTMIQRNIDKDIIKFLTEHFIITRKK